MLIKIMATVSLLCFIQGLLPGLPRAEGQEILTLKQAVDEVIKSSPDLAAIQARARALADIPAQAATLPDPVLTTRMANLPLDSFSNTQEAMTQAQLGISLKLPYPGKLALRKQAAEYASQAAKQDIKEKKLQLVRDVRTVWWNIFYLDRALETVDRNKQLIGQFIEIAQTRYQVGKGLQQDVLLAQLELSKLLDIRIGLTNVRKNEGERLNALLNRTIGRAVLLPTAVDQPLPTPLDLDRLLDRALQIRPLLESLRQKVERNKVRVELAHKDYYPDFTVGALYGYRNGYNPNGSERDDFGTVTLKMNLPVFFATRQDRALSQRQNEKRQTLSQLENMEKKVAASVATAMADYRSSVEKVNLFKQGIIPQAQQTLESMLAGYQVNKVDFLNLVQAQTAVYNYETRYWKAISSANQALARLVAVVGEENIYE